MAVKNANLKDAFARIIVESEDLRLMFPGEIKNGKVNVPIRRLNGLLEENIKGKMYLEVVVENTYFKPWSDDFNVEEHTSVKVAVKEQKLAKDNKPLVEVKSVKPSSTKSQNLSSPATHILKLCERFGINKSNLKSRKGDFKQIVREYLRYSPEIANQKKSCVQEALNALME
jgi:hypothetical protein